MRVLVIRNDRVGDLVLALPLIQTLKEAGCFVGVLASAYAAPLLEEDARVDLCLAEGPDAWAKVKEAGFDAAVVLWGNWRNAWRCFLSGIPNRLGISARPFSFLFSQRVALRRSEGLKHESEYNLDLAAPLGLKLHWQAPRLSLGAQAEKKARQALKALGLSKPVILHPGSKGSAQNWEGGRYAELGRELKRRYKAKLLVSFGAGEEVLAREVARACGAKTLKKPLGLRAFAALCGKARLFVSASTGPMHLAAAGGAPTLSLFPPLKPMSPLRWGPRGNRHAVLMPEGLGLRAPQGPDYAGQIGLSQALATAAALIN